MNNFGYQNGTGLPVLRLEDEAALDGVEFTAFGADDHMANTMLTVEAGGERLITRRPEPLLVEFVDLIATERCFVLQVGEESKRVVLTEEQQDHIEEIAEELDEGLENAPLGG